KAAWGSTSGQIRPIPLAEVKSDTESRKLTGIQELDRVLGGGVVPGALTLLGGDPGIGKSTLLLAALDRLSALGPALYVTGEGDRGAPFRILRAHKNRFGSTNEIGVFEMKSGGLAEVPDPSSLFLAERPEGASGSVVTASLSGTRTLLVEIQALVAPTGYGTA